MIGVRDPEVERVRRRLAHLLEARDQLVAAEHDDGVIDLSRIIDPLNHLIRVTVTALDAVQASSER